MAALGPFERAPRLAVAVSGGPDSMALALMAARWVEEAGGTVLGLTVDHGLRPESAAEANQVVAWLGARGIPCRVLTWVGLKPSTGIQAAARSARYALLTAACREAGILHLLLAHHALDQAETACMRAERGSGEQGLAAMAAISERPGLRLLRPLLQVAPEQLRAMLAAMAQPWLDDPSNMAMRFRRARLRSQRHFDRVRWLDVAGAAATVRTQADHAVARFAALAVTPDPLGYLTLDLGPWCQLPDKPATLVLARCIHAVSGRPHPPPAASLARLAASLRQNTHGPRTSLGGTLLLRQASHLVVVREPGRIRDRREIVVGDEIVWDGRFLVRYHAGPGKVIAGALGAAANGLLRTLIQDRWPRWRPPPWVLPALPGLWHDGALVASPLHVAGNAIRADIILRPASPVAPATFAGPNVV